MLGIVLLNLFLCRFCPLQKSPVGILINFERTYCLNFQGTVSWKAKWWLNWCEITFFEIGMELIANSVTTSDTKGHSHSKAILAIKSEVCIISVHIQQCWWRWRLRIHDYMGSFRLRQVDKQECLRVLCRITSYLKWYTIRTHRSSNFNIPI